MIFPIVSSFFTAIAAPCYFHLISFLQPAFFIFLKRYYIKINKEVRIMHDKGKITAYQMALMIYPTIYATAVLMVPEITGQYVGRDSWAAPILGSLNGFFTAYVLYKLHKMYPNESLIQYSKHIIGPFLSKILGLFYLFFFLYMCGFILKEYSFFIGISLLPKTPMIAIIGSVVIMASLAITGGVEILGRASQLFVPIFILPIPIFTIMLLKDLDPKNVLPILEHGLLPLLQGSAAPQAWFSEVFLISMFLPFLKDPEKGLKWSFISLFAVLLSLVSLNLLTTFLFGEMTASYTFPVFKAVRIISLSDFFEHLEAGIITIWILGAYIKITVFYYALVLGTAQWLNLSDFKPIVLPFGLLISLFAIWEFANLQEQFEFSKFIFPFYVPFMLTVLPTILLIIAKIRTRNTMKKEPPRISNY
ncbi:GerAB/ArcD/ProY family transporter [Neobacillus novalis]|uniref:GerAB/ArcD/ProY family transporter n=1 Tax=Neobacillus novalis TaxID=220687 RepID=UPI001F3A1ECB|nr:endospore germination permease [Neobacillus novalis]